MSSTTNISINSRSMNGIITISDGTATIEDGNITCTDLTGTTLNVTNVDTTNMTLQNLNMTGSLEVPDVNDILTPYGYASFANYGDSIFYKNCYMTGGYFLPICPLTSQTSYRIGLNSMENMYSGGSTNTIAIGLNTMRGTAGIGFNEMPKSVVIGNNAFSTPYQAPTAVGISSNNVIIGDNGCKNNTWDKDCVIIGGQACSSSNLISNFNSVVLGANVGTISNSFGAGYNNSVVIGSNLLLRSGVSVGVVIGADCFKNSTFAFANGPCVVGYNSATNVINFNRLTIFGNGSGQNVNVDAHNMIIGPEAGNGIITNTYTTCIGGFSNASNGLVSATALGVNCVVAQSHTLKVGGNDGGVGGLGYTRHQDLLIPQKNRLLCGTFVGAVASYSPLFESGEYIFVNSATTTSITLFPPLSATTGSQNISTFGTTFTIIRTTTAANSNITINAPSGQFIIFNGVASSTYAFSSSESYVTFVCCNNGAGNSTWAVSSSPKILNGYVDLTTNQNIAGIKSFTTELRCNEIQPNINANTINLFSNSTASIINIGSQSTAQIINFSKINTNSIEPKAVGTDLNLFTTTIASVLTFGNSLNYLNAYLYLNPTIAGTSIHTGTSTFNGGITANATQTINFGANAPTMRGDNIVANSIGQTQIDSGYLDLFTNQSIPFGVKTFVQPPIMSGASITANSIPNSALQTNVTLNDTTSTFSAVKTFTANIIASASQTINFGTNAPTMSGAGISNTSIPNTALQTNVTLNDTSSTFSAIKTFTANIIASVAQTINFGANAPTMSGAGISNTSIPNTALQTNVTLNDTSSTFSAVKTFTANIIASATQTINFGSNAPTMSGAGISSTTIPNSALQSTVTLNTTSSTFSAQKTFTSGIVATSAQSINFGSNEPFMKGSNITFIPLSNIIGYDSLPTLQNTSYYFPTMTNNAITKMVAHTYDPLYTNNTGSTTIISSGGTYFYSVYLTAGLVIRYCDVYINLQGTTQTVETSLYSSTGTLTISFGTNSACTGTSYNKMTAGSAVTISTSGFYWIAFKSIHSGATLPKFAAMVKPTGSPLINFYQNFNNVSAINAFRACAIFTSVTLTGNLPLGRQVIPIEEIIYLTLS